MKSVRRSMLKAALPTAVSCLTLDLWSSAAFSQAPPPPRGPGITIDPRAQDLKYHFDDANADMQYCLFVSSKVSKRKKAPLIIALHGLGAGPQIMCNKAAVDLAEEGGYILVAPMGYSTAAVAAA
jgi:poly(3-hydroxybutyrate) depolymerase